MQPNEYQELTEKTELYTKAANTFADAILANPPRSTLGEELVDWLKLAYCTGKLNGEAGEAAEIVFKAFRGQTGRLTDKDQLLLWKEMGDILWYVARICGIMGWELESVMESNIKKLQDRKERGVLHGYGDER